MGRRRTVWQPWEGIFINGIFIDGILHLIVRIVLSLASNLHVFRTVLICLIFVALFVLFYRKLFCSNFPTHFVCDSSEYEETR